MKSARQSLILLSIVCVLISGFLYGQKTLAELYKKDKVRFVQEMALDEKTMPKDVLFGALARDKALGLKFWEESVSRQEPADLLS